MKYLKTSLARKKKRISMRIKEANCKKPVLYSFISNSNVYAQIISEGRTIVSASTLDKSLQKCSNCQMAASVGKLIAERALSKNITTCVFNRGSRAYHGKVKALVESARTVGLII